MGPVLGADPRMSDDNKLGPVARRLAATQRVLCVEDEPDIAAFLRAYFRASGYDVVHIDPDDVDGVVEAMHTHGPDAVLLDVHLRGFSGIDAYRRLRAEDRWAFVPVIMVSGDASVDPTAAAPKGLDAFVTKPFNTNVLADLVRTRLQTAALLAERGRHQDFAAMTQDYLEARLTDEVAVSGTDGTFSFGLLRLLSMEAVIADVGRDGRDHLVTHLIRNARTALPANVVIGFTDADEIAVVFPALAIDDAQQALEAAIASLTGRFEFPGGASVPVDMACGLASYPDHAVDTDGLFMAADAALAEAVESGTLLHRAL